MLSSFLNTYVMMWYVWFAGYRAACCTREAAKSTEPAWCAVNHICSKDQAWNTHRAVAEVVCYQHCPCTFAIICFMYGQNKVPWFLRKQGARIVPSSNCIVTGIFICQTDWIGPHNLVFRWAAGIATNIEFPTAKVLKTLLDNQKQKWIWFPLRLEQVILNIVITRIIRFSFGCCTSRFVVIPC